MLPLTPETLHHAEILWDFHHLHHTLEPADLILVLGSHDRRVADHAATLWHRGLAPQMLVSGGIAHVDDIMATGWDKSEAEVFAERMMAAGVPADKIWLETHAQNTGDNFTLGRQVLAAKNYHPQQVILVTKPYMERRALSTGLIRWPDIQMQVSSQPITLQEYLHTSEKGAEVDINVMVGDLQRLKLYPAKGFMAPTDIPAEVWASFEALVTLGFTQHLVK